MRCTSISDSRPFNNSLKFILMLPKIDATTYIVFIVQGIFVSYFDIKWCLQ